MPPLISAIQTLSFSLSSAMSIAESSKEPGYGEENAAYHPMSHSNSTGAFNSVASASGSQQHRQRTQL